MQTNDQFKQQNRTLPLQWGTKFWTTIHILPTSIKCLLVLLMMSLGNSSYTDWTSPSIPLLTEIIHPTSYKERCWCSFFTITRSFSLKSRFSRFHFLRIFDIGKYSCVKRFQDILLNASTALQRAQLTVLSSFHVNANDCLLSIKYNHLGHQ